MEKVIEFIQNAWVIGIVGGTISGIIVYYLTIYVIDRKKKRDHRRNVTYANNAVLDILRPYIANLGLPEKKEIQAIINSMSRQYGVKSNEMYSITVFYEDLIVEFFKNLYIPDEVKKKNIEKLIENIDIQKNREEITSEQEQKKIVRSKTVQNIGILFGALSTIFSILLGAMISGSGNGSFNYTVILICVIILAIMITLCIWSYLRTYRIVKKRNIIYPDENRKYFVNRDFLKMVNCGSDINNTFDSSFLFINYSEEDE